MMAQTKVAYQDNSGQFHSTPEASTIADLARLVNNAALGRDIFEKRADIERIFEEHDRMLKIVEA
jgi:hypothetical protein